MKNWKKAGIGALCVAALLAGCGTQGGKDDGEIQLQSQHEEGDDKHQHRGKNCFCLLYTSDAADE